MSSNINKYNLKAKTRVSRISHSENRIFEYIENIRMMDKMTAKDNCNSTIKQLMESVTILGSFVKNYFMSLRTIRPCIIPVDQTPESFTLRQLT